MLGAMKLDYLEHRVVLGAGDDIGAGAAAIGRVTAGDGLTLRPFATLRADGEAIDIGDRAWFGERASVHIVDGQLCTRIGHDVTVGRFGLVHACSVGDGCVIGESAAVLDGASLGPHAVLAADSVVTPRKALAGGWLYAGAPAKPVREIDRDEADWLAAGLRTGAADTLLRSGRLPPLGMDPFLPHGAGTGSLHAWEGRRPRIARAYVAPTAVLAGEVILDDDAGVYFGCALAAHGAAIVVGARSNIQDNSILRASAASGALTIGSGVTVGHNVEIGAGVIGDDALIGMASRVADGVVVEAGGCIAAGSWVAPGTVVREGWIVAGRPARAFRKVSDAERAQFARGRDVYVGYGAAYRGEAPTPMR
jgi:carbonic anhydrase/acetyltransferase-like protein (isoleucine patch superfamily)